MLESEGAMTGALLSSFLTLFIYHCVVPTETGSGSLAGFFLIKPSWL